MGTDQHERRSCGDENELAAQERWIQQKKMIQMGNADSFHDGQLAEQRHQFFDSDADAEWHFSTRTGPDHSWIVHTGAPGAHCTRCVDGD
jgi:hypothetical protein